MVHGLWSMVHGLDSFPTDFGITRRFTQQDYPWLMKSARNSPEMTPD